MRLILIRYGIGSWLVVKKGVKVPPMEIIVPDMGHGDCVGIFRPKKALLIDFGTNGVKRRAGEAQEVENMINTRNERKLIISHYHSDHYSLVKRFPSKYFDESYLPALPPRTAVGRVLLQTLALLIVMRYRHYPLIPEIIRTSRKIRPSIRSDTFTAVGLRWKVEWPDYRVLEKIRRVHNKSENLRRKISRITQKLSEAQRRRFEEIYGYLSRSLAPEERYENLKRIFPEMDRYEISGNSAIDNNSLRQHLREVEKDFKGITNYASLIVRNNLFLFTGDVANKVLDSYVRLNDQPYFFAKASHHGSCYGSGLDGLSGDILTISRDKRSKIRKEYFYNVDWKILIDTARHGSCYLNV